MREQRKESSGERSDEGVDGDGTVRVEAVAVNEVAQTLPEWDHATKAYECNGQYLRYPCDVRIARPREPECY